MQAEKAQASLHICVDSTEPSLLSDAISTENSCLGAYICAIWCIVYLPLFGSFDFPGHINLFYDKHLLRLSLY